MRHIVQLHGQLVCLHHVHDPQLRSVHHQNSLKAGLAGVDEPTAYGDGRTPDAGVVDAPADVVLGWKGGREGGLEGKIVGWQSWVVSGFMLMYFTAGVARGLRRWFRKEGLLGLLQIRPEYGQTSRYDILSPNLSLLHPRYLRLNLL